MTLCVPASHRDGLLAHAPADRRLAASPTDPEGPICSPTAHASSCLLRSVPRGVGCANPEGPTSKISMLALTRRLRLAGLTTPEVPACLHAGLGPRRATSQGVVSLARSPPVFPR